MPLTLAVGSRRAAKAGRRPARWLQLVGGQAVGCAFCGGAARVMAEAPARAAICGRCVQRAALLLQPPAGGDAA